MANLKQRLHRKNAQGSYDVIYLETSAEIVKRADGTTTVEQSLTSIEDKVKTAATAADIKAHNEAADAHADLLSTCVRVSEEGVDDSIFMDADLLQGHPADYFAKMADSYVKTEILSAATKEAFGLGIEAIPDNVFSALPGLSAGLVNKYIWSKKTITLTLGSAQNAILHAYMTTGNGKTISYSDEIELGADGNLSEKKPFSTVSITYNDYALADVLAGKFFMAAASVSSSPPCDTMFYGDKTGTGGRYLSGVANANYTTTFYPAYKVTSMTETDDGYILTDSENAHESGVWVELQSGIYEVYTLIGKIGDKLSEGVKIATGSYIGTGTYGESNPTSLTFNFEPTLILIQGVEALNGNTSPSRTLVLLKSSQAGLSIRNDDASGNSGQIYTPPRITWNGKTVSWYVVRDNGAHQANGNGYTYYYIAIG